MTSLWFLFKTLMGSNESQTVVCYIKLIIDLGLIRNWCLSPWIPSYWCIFTELVNRVWGQNASDSQAWSRHKRVNIFEGNTWNIYVELQAQILTFVVPAIIYTELEWICIIATASARNYACKGIHEAMLHYVMSYLAVFHCVWLPETTIFHRQYEKWNWHRSFLFVLDCYCLYTWPKTLPVCFTSW